MVKTMPFLIFCIRRGCIGVKTTVQRGKCKIRTLNFKLKNNSDIPEHSSVKRRKIIGRTLTFWTHWCYTVLGKKMLSVTDGIVEHHKGAGGLFFDVDRLGRIIR